MSLVIEDVKLTDIEQEFIATLGVNVFYDVYEYIKYHEIIDFYNKARKSNDGKELCLFGVHYGILAIVVFCYCKLKVSLDIDNVTNGYFKTINSTTIEVCDNDEMQIGTPLIHGNYRDGITLATIDKFTLQRSQCIQFLIRMKRFSKFVIEQNCIYKKQHYIYTIVDTYVDKYKLLESYT
jgi:hypothetical protein